MACLQPSGHITSRQLHARGFQRLPGLQWYSEPSPPSVFCSATANRLDTSMMGPLNLLDSSIAQAGSLVIIEMYRSIPSHQAA